MKKNGNRKQLPFTLIELIIVIAILSALTALILPAFSTTEKDAKETSDAYNSRGIVRYVQMFQNANGSYPSGFHTGLMTDGATPMPLPETFGVEDGELEDDGPMEIITVSDTAATPASGDTSAADAKLYITSLKTAGINYLTAGDVAEATATPLKNTSVTIPALQVKTDNDEVKDLLFNGRQLKNWIKPEQFEMGEHHENGIIVALFLTPNVDWETVYSGGYHQHEDHGHFEIREKSKIALKNTPVSTASKDDFRYYCCLFKLYKDGSPARLVGVVSPEMTVAE